MLAKICFIWYKYKTDGGENLKLTFAFDMKLNETQEKIVREIKWHVSKVYNTLNYSIREEQMKKCIKYIGNIEKTIGIQNIYIHIH